MAILDWPTAIALRNAEWGQPPVEQVNRSAWTGGTRIVLLGAAARWNVSGDFPPMDEAKMLIWRGFVFALRGRANSFRLKATLADQHAGTPTVRVNGAIGPFDLPLDGLPASATLLPAGSLITVPLPSGDEQLVGLAAPLAANASGQATAVLGTALREPPADNTIVESKRPWGLLRSPIGARWSVEPGSIYTHGFEAEEAF